MSVLLFPDTTVLTNFTLIHRMDLLQTMVGERGRWCRTVADECAAGARTSNLIEMSLADGIFGTPWTPQGDEHESVERYRLDLAKPGDSRQKHLGEAETIALMESRAPDGIFVTDDKDARQQGWYCGLEVSGTGDLFKRAVQLGLLDVAKAYAHIEDLRSRPRSVLPDTPDDPERFARWCTESR